MAGSCGTVFKITPGGTFTTLHNFDGADDEYLYAGLVQATNGNFYGTTYLGGADTYGTVFEITPPGTVIILANSLTGATIVTFNGTVATFTLVSSSEITATVPTGATTGKVKVVTPQRTLTSNVNFRVLP